MSNPRNTVTGESLTAIFNRSKTSKGRVGFADVYEPTIGARRGERLRILEIGIHHGYSLAAWLKYCPQALVTGIDTFQRIPPEGVPVLEQERVAWRKADSTKPPAAVLGPFDFIIDDGCHFHRAQRQTFGIYFPLLAEHGSYFIEDVWPFDLMSDEDKQHQWLKDHPGGWSDDEYARLLADVGAHDVRHHDLRVSSGIPNSDRYIIEVRRRT